MNAFQKIPDWLRSVLLWLVGFALLLMLFEWERMHHLDARLAYWMQSNNVPFSENVMLLDVPLTLRSPDNPDDQCPDKNFRGQVGSMLKLLAGKETPGVVALDIAFSSACGSDEGGVAEGVKALTDKGVAVFGVYGMDSLDDKPDSRSLRGHVKAIYDNLNATGHTWFGQAKEVGGLWPAYPPCLWAQSQGATSSAQRQESLLMGLPLLATGLNHVCVKPAPGEDPERWRVPVVGKLAQVVPSQVLHFEPNKALCVGQWRNASGECLTVNSEWKGKLVVVGNLEHDRPYAREAGPYKDISGPEIVAWAISDLKLRGEDGRAHALINMPGLHLGLSLVTALLAFVMFSVLQRVVPRLKLSPFRLALFSALLGLLLPLVLIGMARLFRYDYSQVLLPVLTTALTLALAARHQMRVLAEVAIKRQTLINPDAAAYDIFLSYRHSHASWVMGTLRPMLAELRHLDGRALTVFIDDRDIHASQNWASRLGQVIHHSRIFLAVLTPDYFEPNARGVSVCTWEMEQALQRHAESAMSILPVFHAGYEPASAAIPPKLAALRAIQGPFSHNETLAQMLRITILAALDQE